MPFLKRRLEEQCVINRYVCAVVYYIPIRGKSSPFTSCDQCINIKGRDLTDPMCSAISLYSLTVSLYACFYFGLVSEKS